MIWAVAQTESMRERVAQRWLGEAQFETYLPMIRVKKRIVPLFPAYLFVRIGDTGWSRVDNTIGVRHLLRSNDKPARIADVVVEAFRRQEKNGLIKLPEKGPLWKVGDRVRIAGGTFLGQIGLFDGMAAHERVFVLLDLFGRQTRTELACAEIHKLEESQAMR
jgi:transcriptional antiterminator RfaH